MLRSIPYSIVQLSVPPNLCCLKRCLMSKLLNFPSKNLRKTWVEHLGGTDTLSLNVKLENQVRCMNHFRKKYINDGTNQKDFINKVFPEGTSVIAHHSTRTTVSKGADPKKNKMGGTVNGVSVSITTELNSSSHDAVVLVTYPKNVNVSVPKVLADFVKAAVALDKGLKKVATVLNCPLVSGGRVVVSPTGPITPYDDVRSVGEAAKAGIARAIQAGAKNPILVVQNVPQFPDSDLVLLLGAFEALYVPLQVREFFPDKSPKLTTLGLFEDGLKKQFRSVIKNAVALEAARGVSRDIGGADPERMSPGRVWDYVRDTFADTSVTATVLHDHHAFRERYPLFAAVDRAANSVPRHRGHIIFLEYVPEGDYEETVMLVGKGVTYDTGGCDIKAGGVMAGMSRDKCGAAAVAGFFKACQLLGPKIKAIGAMGMVRNSVGEEAYVADELLLSRLGVSVRVGNTDAEGRMVCGDLLAEMREKAEKEKNPHIYTIATLTGHAHRTVGEGYTIIMDNHAARAKNHSSKFRESGELLADMVEISTIRREDLNTHAGQAEGDDVLQALNAASSASARGHQGPAAFLLLVSKLHQSEVPYSHVDIAASGGSLPKEPTAAPLLALANLHRLLQY